MKMLWDVERVTAMKLLWSVAVVFIFSGQASATVTYDGTGGVAATALNKTFTNYSCQTCHSTTLNTYDAAIVKIAARTSFSSAQHLSTNYYTSTEYNNISTILQAWWDGGQSQNAMIYDGTGGVAATVLNKTFTNYSCQTCHSTTLNTYDAAIVKIAARTSFTSAQHLDTNYYTSTEYNNILATLQAWWDGGQLHHLPPLQNSAPSVTTNTVQSITNTQSTLKAWVNDNGIEASYTFQWEVDDGNSADAFSDTTIATDNDFNSGGGSANDTASANISGLSCGTSYQYRVVGTNTPGTSYGNTNTFSTSACNKVPTINAISNQTATEDSPFAFNVTVTDQDGALSDSLSYSFTSNPTGMTISSSGVINWTPTSETQTSVTVGLKVTDADADAGYQNSTRSFVINITLVNEPPTFTPTPSKQAVENQAYSYTFTATDPESATLSYSLSSVITASMPAGLTGSVPSMSLNSASGLLSWSPDGSVTAADITVTVFDELNSVPYSYSISVTTTNDPPVFTPVVNQVINEEQALSYDIDASDFDGDTLAYSLTQAPTGMTIDSVTGVINWILMEAPPTAPVIETVIVGVTDTTVLITTSFTVTVNPINDPPQLASIAAVSVTELSTLSVNAGAKLTDPDDANDGSGAINWSLSGEPTGITISNVGIINWTPQKNSAGIYSVGVQAEDGNEDNSSPLAQTLSITVNLLDSDGDTLADYSDNCPNTANQDQADLDQDSLGDLCDDDIDGDGISNVAETANNLNPRDNTDANLDLDGDGLSNLEEFLTCDVSDTSCLSISVDSVPPQIIVQDLSVISTGYLTSVNLTAAAIDGNTTDVIPTPDQQGPFRPGRNIVVWTASDTAGNSSTAEQIVNVLPLLSLAGAQVSGEGRSINVPVTLNGLSPTYPVTINYSISGQTSNADYDLRNGQIQIANGDSSSLSFTIFDDGIIEGDEELIISLTNVSGNAAMSNSTSYRVLIVERNIEPSVQLTAEQAGVTGFYLYQDQGVVTVSAQASDPNGDAMNYDWSESDLRLAGTAAGNQFSFDAGAPALANGAFTVTVNVSDGIAQSKQMVTLVLAATPPVLSAANDTDNDGIDDASEGRSDTDADGLPDYLDAVDDVSQLQTRVAAGTNNNSRMVNVEPGLSLVLGSYAIKANRGGVRISEIDITDDNGAIIIDPDFSVFGGYFDFEVHGLSEAQRSAMIVLPLTQTVPANAGYRKLINNNWFAFIEDGTDQVSSAFSVDNECPTAGDAAYQPGLQAFSDCVQLTLTDGGPNDADQQINGVIQDPGGVAINSTVPGSIADNSLTPPDDSPDGSGSLGWLWLTLLSVAIFLRRKHG